MSSPRAHRPRSPQPSDRLGADDLGAHGQTTRPEHPWETRAPLAARSRRFLSRSECRPRGGGPRAMNSSRRRQPLVAVLFSVPLLCEAIASALDDIAEVRTFPARRSDTVGLLRSLQPDAVVVDDPIEALELRRWAE